MGIGPAPGGGAERGRSRMHVGSRAGDPTNYAPRRGRSVSLAAMLWALNEAQVTDPVAKLILIAMGDHANPQGQGCYAAQSTLAAQALCTDRTVRTHISEMERAGVIRRGDQQMVDHFRPDRRPVVWDLAMTSRPEISSGRKLTTVTAGNSRPNDRKPASDKPSTNQELEPGKIDRNSADPLLASLRTEIPRPAPRCAHGEPLHRHPNCVA